MNAPTHKPVRRQLDLNRISPKEAEFAAFLNDVIIGQENGRRAAQRAYRRTLAKVRSQTGPLYTLLNIGPSSCGKTEIAHRLAEFLHGDRDALLHIDCSQYMEKHLLSGLIGTSAGYVGFTDTNDPRYEEPEESEKDPSAELSMHNLLWSRKGSETPVTIVLLDEWEKACPEFNNILLRIFREGTYTMGNNKVVSFRRCIFILTSNLGAEKVEEATTKTTFGFDPAEKPAVNVRKIFDDHLKAFARPEFRNRLLESGEICFFDNLTEKERVRVCDLKLNELIAKVEEQVSVKLKVDNTARDWLLKQSHSVAGLNGVIVTHVQDALNNLLALDDVAEHDNVYFTHKEGDDRLSAEALSGEQDTQKETSGWFDVEAAPLPDSMLSVPPRYKRWDESPSTENAPYVSAVENLDNANSTDLQRQKFRVVCKNTSDDIGQAAIDVGIDLENSPQTSVLKVKSTFEVLSTFEEMSRFKQRFPHLKVIAKQMNLNPSTPGED